MGRAVEEGKWRERRDNKRVQGKCEISEVRGKEEESRVPSGRRDRLQRDKEAGDRCRDAGRGQVSKGRS